MADDNPPIAQPEPASLGNKLPTDSSPTAAASAAPRQDHQDLPQPSPSNSTSATAIVAAASTDADAITPPKALIAASAKPNLSFATETHTQHVPVNDFRDLTHVDTNVDMPMPLNGAVSSVAEGYSIYSNIKDGKVMNGDQPSS